MTSTSSTSPVDGALTDALTEHLKEIVGPTNVLTDPSVTASYAVDWSGRFQGYTPLVVRPADTAQVSASLSVLANAGVCVVPQGGNTGLVGGSVPLSGEVVLSLARLTTCGPVDELSSQATFGAGVTLANAQAHAATAELAVGVDLAARDSATIGGMVSTNAGGINVVRYGAMRAQVVGIEAVLADGTVLSHLAGLAKDNTGYDLAGLLTGSEGTLAVVTAVRLQLRPALTQLVTALLALGSVSAGVHVAAKLRNKLGSIYALEAVFDNAMSVVCLYLGVRPPVGAAQMEEPPAGTASRPMWLLVEVASNVVSVEALADELANAVDALGDLVADVAVGLDSTSRRQLWAFREQIPEAVNAVGTPHKLDVTLPASRLVEFVEGVPAVVEKIDPGAQTVLFGHLGDGNVHVNVLPSGEGSSGGQSSEHNSEQGGEIDAAVLAYTAQLDGSISAEHGVGTAKKQFLHLNRTPAELAAFAALKQALDPHGVLNPNVLLVDSPAGTSGSASSPTTTASPA